jgi:hypothetical protein
MKGNYNLPQNPVSAVKAMVTNHTYTLCDDLFFPVQKTENTA